MYWHPTFSRDTNPFLASEIKTASLVLLQLSYSMFLIRFGNYIQLYSHICLCQYNLRIALRSLPVVHVVLFYT